MENYVLHIIIRIKTTKRYVQFLGHRRGQDLPSSVREYISGKYVTKDTVNIFGIKILRRCKI